MLRSQILCLQGLHIALEGFCKVLRAKLMGVPLRVDHADYFGDKDRLFYTIYPGMLILLQVEGHDFYPRNGIVRIER